MKKCDDGSYCDLTPGDDVATACCISGEGLFVNVVDGQVTIDSVNAATTSATSSSGSEASSTSVGSATSTITMIPIPSSNDSGLSIGAKAGIGVGVGSVALMVLAIMLWIFIFRKKRRQLKIGVASESTYGNETSSDERKELPSSDVIPQRVELEQPHGFPSGRQHSYQRLRPELE